MRALIPSGVVAAILFSLSVGCGDGTDGAGGNAASTTSTVSTSTTAPSTTSTGTSGATSSTGGGTLCDQHCATEAMKGCALTDCASSCQHGAGPMGACAAEQSAMIACYDKPTTDCHDHSNDCYAEELAYAGCLSTHSSCGGSLNCTGGPSGTCTCDLGCGADSLRSQCAQANGVIACDCLKNGAVVGHCTETPQTSLSCEYYSGCCAIVAFPSP
jgi:hypothetical protein